MCLLLILMAWHMKPMFRDTETLFLRNSPQRKLLPLWNQDFPHWRMVKLPTPPKPQSACKLSYIPLPSQVATLLLQVSAISFSVVTVLWCYQSLFVFKLKASTIRTKAELPLSLAHAPLIHIFSFSSESCCLASPSNPLHRSGCSSQHYHAVSVGSLSILC